ncbi:hypothetical protein ACED96_15475 [Clostridium thermobutyricum]
MENVQKVYTTKEIADKFGVSTTYILRVANHLLDYGYISEKDYRRSGKTVCLYNDKAVREIAKKLNK